jgi:hypothetical protein
MFKTKAKQAGEERKSLWREKVREFSPRKLFDPFPCNLRL